MTTQNHESIFLKNGAIFRFTKDFGEGYKCTVGESLKKETNETLTACKRNPDGVRLHPNRCSSLKSKNYENIKDSLTNRYLFYF